MSKTVPQCRSVTVHTFRGDRGAFGQRVRKAIDDERDGRGDGPTRVECLLYAGHTGIATQSGGPVYGFNPDFGKTPLWQAMQALRNGDAFPGVVLDDKQVFAAASKQRLTVKTLTIILPDPRFHEFEQRLSGERKKSQYKYGFPNGDGDCNCTTWLERLALPLLSGRMDEFTSMPGFSLCPNRRFGECI